MKHSLVSLRTLCLVPVLVLAGCAGAPDKDSTAKADEYEYVTPLGSNVPQRVKKGQRADTASPTASMTGDQAANALHGGGGQMTPPRGAGGP